MSESKNANYKINLHISEKFCTFAPKFDANNDNMRKLIILALAALCFSSCGQKKEVPFTEAHNYFVRNDVTGSVPTKIGSLEAFERYFGMAAFMGKKGQPTPIDFEKQFAIAVVLPETNHSTELHAVNLKDNGQKLTFTYHADVAPEENTWTQVPMLLIFVDRKFERDSVELNCK
jgi:hypothetical protein